MAAIASQNILRVGRQQAAPLAGCYATQRRTEFTVVKPGDHGNLASYRRGRGGRSSFSGIVATVFGATGFMGKGIVNRLGRIGSQVICPYRGHEYYTKDLKLAGDLGQILFMPYDIRNDDDIRKAIKHSNVVINLVAKNTFESRNFTYDYVNHVTAERIARISREMGVERLIHFSDLAANDNEKGELLPGGSKYLLSKQRGEDAVRNQFPNATIFRPSAIIGQKDSFTWLYLSRGRRTGIRALSLWRGGKHTIKAPVFCVDLATGVANALQDPNTKGWTIEAHGPRKYTLGDIVEYILRECRDEVVKVKDLRYSPRTLLNAWAYDKFLTKPPFTLDSLEAELASDIITGGHNLEDLGVRLSPIEPIIHTTIRTFRHYTYQEDPLMEDSMEAAPPIFENINRTPIVDYGH